MPTRLNVNLTSIILIVILAAAIIFFLKFYTPAALKEAIRDYQTLVDSLRAENEKIYAERDTLESKYDNMQELYANLQTSHAGLEREHREALRDLDRKLKMIPGMPLDSIIEHTRIYLNKYQANELAVTPTLSGRDIYRARNGNVTWSQVSTRTNFYILTEHDSYKSNIIPNLTAQCDTLDAMTNNLKQQVANREEMINNVTKELDNEKVMLNECNKTLDICKKQVRIAQLKFLGIGLAVGIPVGIGGVLLIQNAID